MRKLELFLITIHCSKLASETDDADSVSLDSLGEQLYDLIDLYNTGHTQKITGMLLEQKRESVRHLLSDPALLEERVKMALETLQDVCVSRVYSPPGLMSHLPSPDSPPGLMSHLPSPDSPPGLMSHLPSSDSPPGLMSHLPSPDSPPGLMSHLPSPESPPGLMSHLPSPESPPGLMSHLPSPDSPPGLMSHLPSPDSPPGLMSHLPSPDSPPGLMSHLPSPDSPPGLMSHLPSPDSPPGLMSHLPSPDSPPGLMSHLPSPESPPCLTRRGQEETDMSDSFDKEDLEAMGERLFVLVQDMEPTNCADITGRRTRVESNATGDPVKVIQLLSDLRLSSKHSGELWTEDRKGRLERAALPRIAPLQKGLCHCLSGPFCLKA
ncbi:hypothetical protein P4O66_004087 [Electrophorus voltai]|uniref:PABC domain-containing protein n=1 Tax=Electrophorus voltai TaxID=2609070 RepID=A0AAD8ZQY4_9TELE|nr:hypothetical protein P4O66_004087 [Electrophorus voltai]